MSALQDCEAALRLCIARLSAYADADRAAALEAGGVLPDPDAFIAPAVAQAQAALAACAPPPSVSLSDAEGLAALLDTNCPAFRAFVAQLPRTCWARYDLSACRLGWEAGRRSAGGGIEVATAPAPPD